MKDNGYQHLTVNHSIQFKNPETGAHTNNVEGMWRHAKASMTQYSRKKHFYAGYLAKYMFLKSCRTSGLDPLSEFFQLARVVYDPSGQMQEVVVVEHSDSSNSDDSEDEFN